MPSFGHCYFTLISPFSTFTTRGFDLCFLICNTVHKAPSVFRSLLDIEREAFSIKGTRKPFIAMGQCFNSEGAVGKIPVELILMSLALGPSRGGRESDLLGRKKSLGIKCYLCVNNSSVGNVFLSSEKKYCSGTGWPSFSEAHGTSGSDESGTGILRRVDTSLGAVRTEVVCKQVSFFVFVCLVFLDAAQSATKSSLVLGISSCH